MLPNSWKLGMPPEKNQEKWGKFPNKHHLCLFIKFVYHAKIIQNMFYKSVEKFHISIHSKSNSICNVQEFLHLANMEKFEILHTCLVTRLLWRNLKYWRFEENLIFTLTSQICLVVIRCFVNVRYSLQLYMLLCGEELSPKVRAWRKKWQIWETRGLGARWAPT